MLDIWERPKIKAYIPMYEPLKTETCKNCGKVIAEPSVYRIWTNPRKAF